MLDFYAIGVAVYPMTMNDYYTMQESMSKEEAAGTTTTIGSAEGEGETTINLDKEPKTGDKTYQ